jgi:hypothetical protein
VDRTYAALSLCFLLVACEHAAAPGAVCTTSSQCSAPLACRLGRCRSECVASRDCPIGARCLLDEDGLGACSIDQDDRCESGGASCPTGLTCLGGRCVNTCTDASECPSDGECREAAGAGVSFCFAPEREDGGPATDARDAGSDAASDAFVSDAGPGCTTADCAIDLCMGEGFTCAVRGDRAVVCWGSNEVGQLGDGVGPSTPAAHAAFDCVDAVGTAIDCSPLPVEVLREDGSSLRADEIACAASTACARDAASGRVVCWGDGGNGELALPSGGRAARAHDLPSLPDSVVSIAGGRAFFCAAFTPPTESVCWGDDSYGQFGLPMGTTGNPLEVQHWTGQQLVAGGGATCGLDTDGVVRCAGSNIYGEIGPMAVDPTDGAVQYGPVVVPLPAGPMTSLRAGDSFACALVGPTPTCWGFNGTGSLGRATTTTCGSRLEACDEQPLPIEGGRAFDALWVEGFTSRVCGRSGGSTYCWGVFSEIGCEDGARCDVARVFPELAGASFVATSTRSMCGIVDGRVLCVGNDFYGQLGRGVIGGATDFEPDYVAVCLSGSC